MENQNQGLDILEEKINRIISMMNRLKVENQELKQENQEFKSILHDKENDLERLHAESVNVNKIQDDISIYEDKQEKIRLKVETLLQKLKEFDEIQ